MARHEKLEIDYPGWIDAAEDRDPCLASVARDAYYAKALAERDHAADVPSCDQLLRSAAKSMEVLEQAGADMAKRCAAGDRAARKFWEAKVCARQRRRRKAR
jgi:hypothetical protein